MQSKVHFRPSTLLLYLFLLLVVIIIIIIIITFSSHSPPDNNLDPFEVEESLDDKAQRLLLLNQIEEKLKVKLNDSQQRVPWRETPLLLYRVPVSHFLGKHFLEVPKSCPKQCEYTEDSNLISKALVVIHHVPASISKVVQSPKLYQQATVLLSLESISYYPDLQNWRPSVDWEMSYRQQSDIWAPYLFREKSLRKPPKPKTETTKLVTAFISNCGGANDRIFIFEEVLKLLEVASFGKCFRNSEEKPGETKLEIMSRYKFHLAWENSNAEDYVTEKVYHALEAGTVPIYMGAPNIDSFVPPHSIIKMDAFPTTKELAEFVKQVAANETAYDEYLRWKKMKDWGTFDQVRKRWKRSSRCEICLRAHQLSEMLYSSQDQIPIEVDGSQSLNWSVKFKKRASSVFRTLRGDLSHLYSMRKLAVGFIFGLGIVLGVLITMFWIRLKSFVWGSLGILLRLSSTPLRCCIRGSSRVSKRD